ncbi:MAG: hypothetical protein A3B10_03880 [Candidatus Doudnabacteria bacterium RIFCSPLOWO2_01_FULL_44_21]|uniref:SHS2 domain-containing protein n=1 Tax=Candidatus Doudnabacteria bacterium RIFCSPLOWO2_01_FULL_44_21 TaxID=1817841 RepID=A0A1F5PYH5_9BACT|nr:MAG: hypothetical protein A3B95_01965 [Candidatus Doudnabacteria bacterium RIFCSPHIGHO2_02_FULL_43_13b]OGE94897.1 MAG: hypothetical protein A3B10_03880 [Candidatus Doudnabacteria bacterium RIFCSPLOWO2_01_FULL_44_21]
MSIFGNKKIKVFGLDISDTAIKVMEISKIGDKLVPSAFANVPLSDKVINNHMIISEERLAEYIRRAIDKAGKVNTRFVVCSVPEAKSFVRVVTLPKMPEDEIETAIPYELEQDIPIPIDQVYLDWHILKQTEEKMEILVTAAPKEYIDALIQTLELAKLTPLAMELESQATARALIGSEDMKKTLLIVDLATQQTSFIIVDKGGIEYTSSVPIAGNAFTESIARNLGINKPDAENVKRAMGLTSESKQGSVRDAILPILDSIIDEIKNVIKFFENHDIDKRTIGDIILCGGTAQLLGVADYVSTRINLGSTKSNIRVILGDPWAKVNGYNHPKAVQIKKDEVLGYTTVIGLALRDIDYHPRYRL